MVSHTSPSSCNQRPGRHRVGPWLSGSAGAGTALDSAAGFTLSFTLRVARESHANDNRAGFSIIALDSAARGIELAFWADQVWAQNADFTHGESFITNTQSSARTYALRLFADQYTLATEGTPRLAGGLRDYSGSGPAVVYAQTHFIFVGDDTTSARALTELSAITLAPVPEPAEWALMMAGLGFVAAVVRRRTRVRG